MKTNAVAHFEIYAEDPDALARFYTGLFDWTIEAVPGMDYIPATGLSFTRLTSCTCRGRT